MKNETSDNGTRRKYDEQFKQNAVKMIENGQSTRSVALSLGISEGLLHTAVGNRFAIPTVLNWSQKLLI